MTGRHDAKVEYYKRKFQNKMKNMLSMTDLHDIEQLKQEDQRRKRIQMYQTPMKNRSAHYKLKSLTTSRKKSSREFISHS